MSAFHQGPSTLIEAFAAAGKPTGFVCHAPGVLKDVKGTDGQPLVKGRSTGRRALPGGGHAGGQWRAL